MKWLVILCLSIFILGCNRGLVSMNDEVLGLEKEIQETELSLNLLEKEAEELKIDIADFRRKIEKED